MNVQNKVWVVTGAGSGMGQELTILLLKKKAKVALVDIDEQGMKETVKRAASEADQTSIHVLDLAQADGIHQLPVTVIAQHGQVDGLINNAGIIQPFIDVKDLDFSTINRIMDINFNGLVRMTKAFLPHLLARPEAHIVNVSSMGGFIPFPGQTIYSASKAAVKLFTEGLYAECQNTSVHVTVIHPGAVSTNIMKNSGLEQAKASEGSSNIKMLPADKAAEIMLKGIEKNKFRVLVGSDAKMLDKLYRLAPGWAVRFITKQMGSVKENN